MERAMKGPDGVSRSSDTTFSSMFNPSSTIFIDVMLLHPWAVVPPMKKKIACRFFDVESSVELIEIATNRPLMGVIKAMQKPEKNQ